MPPGNKFPREHLQEHTYEVCPCRCSGGGFHRSRIAGGHVEHKNAVQTRGGPGYREGTVSPTALPERSSDGFPIRQDRGLHGAKQPPFGAQASNARMWDSLESMGDRRQYLKL